jgi:hypothetical protein
MSNEYLIIGLLFVHFVADFMAQTNWMATNKSKNGLALFSHVLVYGLFTLAALGFMKWSAEMIVFYVAVNTMSHFGIDMITSQFTSYFWKKNDLHNFFCIVGFDQFCHGAIIVLTYKWLLL